MDDMLTAAKAAGCEPAVLDWLAETQRRAVGFPDLGSSDMSRQHRAARQLSDALAAKFTLPGPAECEVTEHQVPTRGGHVTVVEYRPPDDDRPLMAHLAIHGGGFVLGSVHDDMNGRVARGRAVAGGVAVFDVDYRLAPEFPFPAGLDDCLDVLDWLVESAAALRIDPGRIGVGGMSAGGNLAALVTVEARDRGIHLDHQVLEVPAASVHIENDESYLAYNSFGSVGDLDLIRRVYLGDPPPATRWAEPAAVPDLTGLPPALVLTAELDPLRDSGEAYVARLIAAGVPVQHWRAPGQMHGSPAITRTSATAREWERRVREFLRSRSQQPATTQS